ncbi:MULTISPECIES: HD family hydrolase [unclassified Chelatococcus]|uniref:YfbR-like 5'-deoxynucleotidase n=1 Tax=unclassified Chelatococcus TaxID=2638111 RepID=UPI001BD1467B|nr:MULTISPECIES: HD family hydrolase [unclassified Chelatococcus]MBS7698313.1 HD family hydrolase [Chelatococcus sp. YT9]MBX3559170.1 HD family hydrolase [Chelatococcus sp.]
MNRTGSKATRAWQRMLSGRRLDLLDPSPLDIEIEDIAHGLARVARWNGQTSGPHIYSVAQHSLLVEAIACHMVSPKTAAAAQWQLGVLLHDAAEYVIGDMISPFKTVMGGTYREVEARLMAAVHLRFGLPATLRSDVRDLTKRADQQAAFLEATQLAGFDRAEALKFFGRPAALPQSVFSYLTPWSADEAKARFLTRFEAVSATSRLSPHSGSVATSD